MNELTLNNVPDSLLPFPEISKVFDLMKAIYQMQIIKVVDETTEMAASDQLKWHKNTVKELNEILEPIKKELKKPGKEFDDFLRPITAEIQRVEAEQKRTLGSYQIAKNIQKAQTEFSTSKTKLIPSAWIVDIVLFIVTNINQGREDELKEIFPKWNEAALEKYCIRHNIDFEKVLYPGLEGKMMTDTKVR